MEKEEEEEEEEDGKLEKDFCVSVCLSVNTEVEVGVITPQ